MHDRGSRILLATLLWMLLVVGLLAASGRPSAPIDVQLSVLPGQQLLVRLQPGGIGIAAVTPQAGYTPIAAIRLPVWVFMAYALVVAAVGLVAGHWPRGVQPYD